MDVRHIQIVETNESDDILMVERLAFGGNEEAELVSFAGQQCETGTFFARRLQHRSSLAGRVFPGTTYCLPHP